MLERLESGSQVEVIAKATDSSHNVMPSDFKDVCNLRGILNNSWHRVKFTIN